ncbi:hypothetical protein TRICI_004051 [Trichomonascus ciferrii]|uniref:Lactoylglutathione lyase n=1 Tax=Trichomonascus ciferrii TaxID=44093 RepID=A0A642V215_9ASCO|nr:hypothetical protein TRICI_004051 [Trichomonascus ciferrii]
MNRITQLARQIIGRNSSTMATSQYAFNHTMFRVKDPKVTIKFYEDNFGMKLLKEFPVPQLGFTNYYLGFTGVNALHQDKPWYEREGVLEICHNYGTEKDDNFVVNNGNVEPHRGFGHICFSVDNIEACCEKLEQNGVSFKKKLSDGRQKDIAFALDPDGYWIELITNKELKPQSGVWDRSNVRFNHTMVRVKDPKKSLKFYQEALGMTLVRTSVHENAKFTLYFLTYTHDNPNFVPNSGEGVSDMEGILELTHNWDTENDPEFKYHNGNDQPQGYGHIGITVPDVDEAMTRLEELGVSIKKRKSDGKMKFIGFVLDPDGYWVEILPRAEIPEKID